MPVFRRPTAPALLALVTLAGIIPTSPAGAACGGGWTQLPNAGAHYAEGIAALSADDAWLIAWDTDAEGEEMGFAYRWDGLEWTQIPIPQPGVGEYVRGIAPIATDDVWIVGTWQENVTYEGHLYAANWDGEAFTRVPIEGGRSARLFAADGVATDDVWTVGYHFVDHKYRSLAMHWDGGAWTEVPTPMPDLPERNLYSVEAIATDDVWAVGSSYTRRAGPRPLALHWDGVSWKNASPSSAVGPSSFHGVAATTPDRVWAVGQTGNAEEMFIQRWNGTAWRAFDVPETNTLTASLTDVSAVSGRQAWAVGSAGGAAGYDPVLLRWNGTAWRLADVPGAPEEGHLLELDSLPTGVSFAAGTASGHILSLQRCPTI